MKVIVLAAGFATRLYPLTRDRAKPLLEVGGAPVLTHLLRRVLAVDGIDEIVVVSNARFAEAFRAWAEGFDVGVPVRVLDDGARDDTEARGALADLQLGIAALPAGTDAVVVAGDNLLEDDLGHAAAEFARERCATIMVRRVDGAVPPGRHGEVTLVEGADAVAGGDVVRFREKPPDPDSPLVAICVYFLPSTTLGRVAEYLASGDNPDAPGHFLAWLVGRERVRAVQLRGRYFDIGNRETLERARDALGGGA